MIYDVIYLGCFDREIGVFQQTAVRVYHILNPKKSGDSI